jgi:protein-tyrosine phosphatase
MDAQPPAIAADASDTPSLRRQLYFSVSLHYQMAAGYDHWNIILGDSPEDNLGLLILGALPITKPAVIPNSSLPYGGNHDEILIQLCASKNKPLKKIISAIQDFEQAGSYTLVYPVQSSEWMARNIDQKQVRIPDDTFNLPKEELESIVDEIHQIRLQGQSCYVHCKAGRGRSWTIIMAYLLKYSEQNTTDLAQAYIKSKRDQVNPSLQQINYIKSFEAYLSTKQQESLDSSNIKNSY